MPEHLESARNGSPTVYLESAGLHSRYNPESEADRYIDSLDIPGTSQLFLVLGPCLGYLILSLRARFPGARIIAIQFSSFYDTAPCVASGDSTWTPSDGAIIPFLEMAIEDREAAQLVIIEWKPALSSYAPEARGILPQLHTFLKRAIANTRTTTHFGQRWLTNATRNIAMPGARSTIVPGDCPIVIAVAGPSLHEALPLMGARRSSIAILAVSSAVEALLGHGLQPDFVVASDGGNWAQFHLFAAARQGLPLIASLHAAIPSRYGEPPLVLFADGSHWQDRLMLEAGLPLIRFPQRGTVSATAIDIAMTMTSGYIYIAGLDLAPRDIQTHCRPYPLNRFHEDISSRFKPQYTGAYERAAMLSASTSHGIYASWFQEHQDVYGQRVRLLGTTASTTGLPLSKEISEGGSMRPHLVRLPVSKGISTKSMENMLQTLHEDRCCQSELNEMLGKKCHIMENQHE